MLSFICCSVFSFKISPSNLTLTDMPNSVKMLCADLVLFKPNIMSWPLQRNFSHWKWWHEGCWLQHKRLFTTYFSETPGCEKKEATQRCLELPAHFLLNCSRTGKCILPHSWGFFLFCFKCARDKNCRYRDFCSVLFVQPFFSWRVHLRVRGYVYLPGHHLLNGSGVTLLICSTGRVHVPGKDDSEATLRNQAPRIHSDTCAGTS